MVTEYLLEPVYVRIILWHRAILESLHLIGSIARLQAIILVSLVDGISVSSGIHKFWSTYEIVKQVIVSYLYLVHTLGSTFCSYEDGTIGTLVAVESCSSGILQDGNTLYLIGTDIVNASLDAIHQDESGTSRKTVQATHHHRSLLTSIVATTQLRDETQAFTNDTVADILSRTLIHILVFDDRHRGSRFAQRECLVGTYVNGLIFYIILRHGWQAYACQSHRHPYMISFHIIMFFVIQHLTFNT